MDSETGTQPHYTVTMFPFSIPLGAVQLLKLAT